MRVKYLLVIAPLKIKGDLIMGVIGAIVTLISFILILMMFLIDIKNKKVINLFFILFFVGVGLMAMSIFPYILELINSIIN